MAGDDGIMAMASGGDGDGDGEEGGEGGEVACALAPSKIARDSSAPVGCSALGASLEHSTTATAAARRWRGRYRRRWRRRQWWCWRSRVRWRRRLRVGTIAGVECSNRSTQQALDLLEDANASGELRPQVVKAERAPITPPKYRYAARLPPALASLQSHPPAGRGPAWRLLGGCELAHPPARDDSYSSIGSGARWGRSAAAPAARSCSQFPSTDPRP